MSKRKINELESLALLYGKNKTLGEIITSLKEKTPYRCPQCNGWGLVTRCIPGVHGYSNDEYVDEECPLCNGSGYTEKEFVPNMVQDGWKIKE